MFHLLFGVNYDIILQEMLLSKLSIPNILYGNVSTMPVYFSLYPHTETSVLTTACGCADVIIHIK